MKKLSTLSMIISILTLTVVGSCARVTRQTTVRGESRRPIDVPHTSVHFPFDSDEVFLKDIALIDTNAEWLKRNRDAVIILEGHCDEHGPSGYNMELGDRRARTVKSHLIERGVPHEKIIMVVSFGESHPVDPNHDLNAWKKNRRVEFILR